MMRSRAPSNLAVVIRIAVLACLGLFSSCHSESAPASKPSDHRPAPPPVLQFAAEADPGETEGVAAYEHGALRLRRPRSFAIKTARADRDQLGNPAIYFEIADAEKEEFKRWTASLVDHRLGVLIDGQLLTAPTVVSELPGLGIIESGAIPWSEAQVRDIAAKIRGESTASK